MRLVHNWRHALKWDSTKVFAALAVVPVVWAQMPPEVTAIIPEPWLPYIVAGVAVAGALGRLRDQTRD